MDVTPPAALAHLAIFEDELRQVGELLDEAATALRARDFALCVRRQRQAKQLLSAVEVSMYDFERACGRSWIEIGLIRGLSKQAAFNQYKRLSKK